MASMAEREIGRGRLIAFEGGEASGKSTQAALLASSLGALLTREPGGTALGSRIRELLLDPAAVIDARAELLLLAADRAQHVAEVIEPALSRGDDVVSDRFAGSSLAYQGYGRGVPLDDVVRVSTWAAGGLEPTVTVLLDVPAAEAAARAGADLDRFEAAGDGFHQRVAEGYRAVAAAHPDRWVVVDGTGTIEDVSARVRAAVGLRLEAR
jgi:dTMP kinase